MVIRSSRDPSTTPPRRPTRWLTFFELTFVPSNGTKKNRFVRVFRPSKMKHEKPLKMKNHATHFFLKLPGVGCSKVGIREFFKRDRCVVGPLLSQNDDAKVLLSTFKCI